jgi:murein DD-endopeptidase
MRILGPWRTPFDRGISQIGDLSRRTVVLLALSPLALAAQDRAPIHESVDLAVPFAPTTVRIDGRTVLVHELHITNLLPVAVTITRLNVTAPGTPRVTLAEHRDSALGQVLGRPGPRSERATPRVINPGLRAVAYLWIPLAENASKPNEVRHHLELEVARPTGAVQLTIEGGRAQVAKTPAVALSPPLRGGPWVAIYDPLLVGGHRTAIYTIDGRARIPGRFAIDWIRLPASGAMDTTRSARPTDWNGFGSEVLAVADGIVAAAMDDVEENPSTPGASGPTITLANASGNYVAIDIGDGRIVFYEHLRHGSVVVKSGDRVKRGQVIGRLGNSGSSSIGPHLHFHVADANSLLGAEGVPFVFTSFQRLGAFRSIEGLVKGDAFIAAPPAPAHSRRMERPDPNAVIRFP